MKIIWISILLLAANLGFSLTYEVPGTHNTIQAAINASASGDTVLVHPGTYNERINFQGRNITVTSEFQQTLSMATINATVIDGGGAGTTVTFSTGESNQARLNGFTVRNGEQSMGGGIYISGASPLIMNCFIRDNSGSNGGAIFAQTSQSKIVQCLFSGNHGTFEAGVLMAVGSQVQLINCVMYGNSADLGAGAIKSWSGSSTLLYNCILWANTPNQITTSAGGLVDCQYSCIQNGYTGTGNISTDPAFVSPSTYDFHLNATSPCLNTGCPDMAPFTLPATDLDGNPRFDGIIDMGVFETAVTVPIIADFTAAPLSGYAPLSVDFTEHSTGNPTQWQWDFNNDGTFDSTQQNPVWTYNVPGVYTVKLVASNTNQSDEEIKLNYINVSAVPTGQVITVPEDFATIQAAINASSDGDTILVAPGNYAENINFLGKAITVGSHYLVTGELDYIYITTITGTPNGSVVKFVTAETVISRLSGFTISGGNATAAPPDDSGGAIYCQNSQPRLDNLRIMGNEASEGGGIGLINASPRITNVRIFDNSAAMSGGGICCHSGSSPIIENALIYDNSAMIGGGVAAQVNSSPVLINCTIINNSTDLPHFAGGFDCYGTCSPIVMNCIFWGNTFSQIVNSSQMYITNSCIQNGQSGVSNDAGAILNWMDGNISTDPLFTDAINCDFHLLINSLCNTGGASTCVFGNLTYFAPPYDLDMVMRPCPPTSQPDMGAYENMGPLEADFSASQTIGTAPLTVQFTDLSTGFPEMWDWDFNGDTIMDSDLQNPEWTFTTPGVYTISLIIWRGTTSDNEIKVSYITVNPVSNNDDVMPQVISVQVYPNPSRGEVSFKYSGIQANYPAIRIYNPKGQLVKILEADKSKQTEIVSWDGSDEQGKKVSPGLYLYQVGKSQGVISGKLLLRK